MISDRMVAAGAVAGILVVGVAAYWYADRIVPPEPLARSEDKGPYVGAGEEPVMLGEGAD